MFLKVLKSTWFLSKRSVSEGVEKYMVLEQEKCF